MPDINQHEDPDALVSGPSMRQRLNVCAMTEDRWIKAGKFPPPDIRINGRKYWREGTYAKWLKYQLEIEADRRGEENG